MFNRDTVINDLKKIREQSPLVHNITNYVVMNNTANALLAIGASPVMAHATEEAADMVNIAGSLVLNIGTLSRAWIEAMQKALEAAKKKGIPVVLDPVGAGATPLRTDTCIRLLEQGGLTVIRGNASEIMALTNAASSTKGVDSTHSAADALGSAKSLAEQYGCVVTISGSRDYITDGATVLEINNGTPMLTRVTGMGCTATALTGAFTAVNSDMLTAAAAAMSVMSIAGELAEKISNGPGSMQANFLDVLYSLDEENIRSTFRE